MHNNTPYATESLCYIGGILSEMLFLVKQGYACYFAGGMTLRQQEEYLGITIRYTIPQAANCTL